MIRARILVLTIFLLLAGCQSLFASAGNWVLDTGHSNFYFSVGHIFSKIKGSFSDYSGEIRFDPTNLTKSSFLFIIKTKSINTGLAKRDKHLQSADFFDSAKYPLMKFASTKITDAGDGLYKVQGKFTVKGEVYELTIPFFFLGIKDHPASRGKEVIGLSGEVMIDRLAYKIGSGKFYALGIVGKDVEIEISLEALRDK